MSHPLLPKNLTKTSALFRQGKPDFTKLAAAAFPTPTVAEAGAILEDFDTGDRYRWTGTVWVQIGTTGSSHVAVQSDPRDFYFEIAQGNILGMSISNIVGTNPLVSGAGFEDIWRAGGFLQYPTANVTVELESLDVNDTAAGTGAQEITIRYMDDTYVEQTPVVVATNGGVVATGITDFFRPIEITATAVGSGDQNAGTIRLQNTSTGDIYDQMDVQNGIGDNEGQNSHFTVPAGKTGYIIGFYEEINKNEDIVFKVRRTDGANGIFRTLLTSNLYQDQFGLFFKAPADPLPEKTDIKIIGKSTNTTAIGTAFYQMILVDN